MGSLIAVLETALPVILALGLGMAFRMTGFLSRETIDGMKKLVLNVTLPALFISAFGSTSYSKDTIILPVFFFCMVALELGLGMLIVKVTKMNNRLAPFLSSACESGMLGYALFALLFPQKSVSGFALLEMGQTLFVFTVYRILIGGKTDFKEIGKEIVRTPILWGVGIGVLIGATGLYGAMASAGVSGVLDGVTSFVSAPTAMVILLAVGYDLVPKEIPWKKTMGLIVMRLFVMAVIYGLSVLINRTLLSGLIMEEAVLLMCILPPPYVVSVFADSPEERVQVSASLSAMTLVTMILFVALSVYYGVMA